MRHGDVEVLERHLAHALEVEAVGQADVDGARGGLDVVDAGDCRVGQAGAQPLVDALQAEVGRDDGRQLGVVAVVEDLEQLLLRPGRGVLRAEVVQDQHRRAFTCSSSTS